MGSMKIRIKAWSLLFILLLVVSSTLVFPKPAQALSVYDYF